MFSKSKVGATETGFVDIESGSEAALMQAVATVGPISVAIDAESSMQSYKGGEFGPRLTPRIIFFTVISRFSIYSILLWNLVEFTSLYRVSKNEVYCAKSL